jgi:hypothetical protein
MYGCSALLLVFVRIELRSFATRMTLERGKIQCWYRNMHSPPVPMPPRHPTEEYGEMAREE